MMWQMQLIFWLILLSPNFSFSQTTTCQTWFAKTGIRSNTSDCDIKCSSAKVDLSTFDCTNQCDQLCKPPEAVNKYAYYIGLTADELSLSIKNPKEAMVVYEQQQITQSLVQSNFNVDRPDSESDAFRHFMWSALLTNLLGAKTASLFLNAHESGLPNSDPGTQMDKYNNDLGIKAAEKLKNSKKFSSEVEIEALTQIKSGKLKVLKPGNLPAKGAK